jgi:hypothetical protein
MRAIARTLAAARLALRAPALHAADAKQRELNKKNVVEY